MVKCADCGFLAIRNKNTRELCEVEKGIRNNGDITSAKNLEDVEVYDNPICFMQKDDLPAKYGECRDPEKILAVFTDERDCGEWTEWQQGFTPKEHREMIDRKWMFDFQEKQRINDKTWQDAQRVAEREWQTKQQSNLVLIAGLFTILGVIIAALISLIVKL